MNNIKKLTYTGLLTALAIVIPLAFGFLKVIIGPFTATITSHVPMFLSMLLGPEVAVMVGIGSAIGFFMTAPAVVAARAAMHIFVGLVGALVFKKTGSFTKAIYITAPVHALLEALVVIPFGFTMYKVLVVVGVGTLLHHCVDATISFALAKSLSKAMKTDLLKVQQM